MMLRKQLDGIVYMGGAITEDHINQFKTARVPVVLAATNDQSKTMPSVNIDYEQAAFEATKHLIKTTKTQPALITGGDHIQNNGLKYKGYVRALKEANIELNEDYIIENESSYNG